MPRANNSLPDWIERQLGQGREFRDMAQPLEARAEDEQRCLVEGYACTFGNFYTLFSMDGYTVEERVDAHAFDQCDMSDYILQVDHHGKVYARNRNNTLSATPDAHGLLTRAQLAGVSGGPDLYGDVKAGYYDKMSFAFRVGKDERKVIEDHDTGNIIVQRTILEITKLYDVSIVSIPANDATEIFARSLDAGESNWAAQELRAYEARRRNRLLLEIRLKMNGGH